MCNLYSMTKGQVAIRDNWAGRFQVAGPIPFLAAFACKKPRLALGRRGEL